ncbi:MAG: response regulator transcription factor [Chloroflexi bacterium]|nr:response regulator transcription factor [Chloroflexota bacterium]
MNPIRILLADDHALVRAGFRSLLQNFPGLEIIGEASNGHEALQMIVKHRPDIVLMDIAMPRLNGLETTARVTKEKLKTRVIIISMHANPEYAQRAIAAGAKGYLLKDSMASELELAIRSVARGETYLTPTVSNYFLNAYTHGTSATTKLFGQLTLRQREILSLMVEGYSRKEISQKLNISVKTFDTYRAQLMRLLNVHDRAELLRVVSEMGLVVPSASPLVK